MCFGTCGEYVIVTVDVTGKLQWDEVIATVLGWIRLLFQSATINLLYCQTVAACRRFTVLSSAHLAAFIVGRAKISKVKYHSTIRTVQVRDSESTTRFKCAVNWCPDVLLLNIDGVDITGAQLVLTEECQCSIMLKNTRLFLLSVFLS